MTVAVLSLIVKAVGAQEDLVDTFENVGYLVIATMLAMVMHYSLTYVGGYFLLTRTNPFAYLHHILPAQTMAFACASSAATIPMTIKCVKASEKVPDAIARFVVPLGATVNMDLFPLCCHLVGGSQWNRVGCLSLHFASDHIHDRKRWDGSSPFSVLGLDHHCLQHGLQHDWNS